MSAKLWPPRQAGDRPRKPHWTDLALCPETDPEAFYPGKGGSTYEAKRVCGACEVRAECLAYALTHRADFGPGQYGIWGGTSPEERENLLRLFRGDTSAAVASAMRLGPVMPRRRPAELEAAA